MYDNKEVSEITPKNLKLCDSDYKFMTAVWESYPINSGELVRLCNEKFGWKKSTVYTMIKKMELKGFVENVNATVSALVPEEACQREEAQYFMERTFQNSMPKFFAAFFGDRKISEEEAGELEALIEEYRQK